MTCLGGEGGHPSHPQAVLAELLVRLGIERASVQPIGSPPPALAARERFVSEALRPAETTHLWSTRHERLDPARVAVALEGIGLVEAADDREEATAIAVILREALEDPARTAALITPDRTLAARVSAELRRWDIRVDDSAGQPLGHGEAGLLARLVAQAAASNFEAQDLLALTAHPLCRVGLPRATLDRARTALEIGVLRGPALESGLDALRAALPEARKASHGHHAKRPQKRLGDPDWAALDALVGGLQDAFAGFTPADHPGKVDLAVLPAAHEQALAAVGRPAAGRGWRRFRRYLGRGTCGLLRRTEAGGRREPGWPVRPISALLRRADGGPRRAAYRSRRTAACGSGGCSKRACCPAMSPFSAGWTRRPGRPKRAATPS